MQELTLKPRSKIKVIRDGKEYLIGKMKVGYADEVRAEIKKLEASGDETSGLTYTVALLVKLGLPEEIVRDLEIEEVEAIINAVSGDKKK